MPENETGRSGVFVALNGCRAFVALRGRSTFKEATSLKRFGITAMERGATELVVDAAECRAMDSTFIGVLVNLALQLQKRGDGRLHLLRVSEDLAENLKTLGADRVIAIGGNDRRAPATSGPDSLSPLADDESPIEKAETAVEAHERLMALSAENIERFRDVVAFLHEDMERHRARDGDPPR